LIKREENSGRENSAGAGIRKRERKHPSNGDGEREALSFEKKKRAPERGCAALEGGAKMAAGTSSPVREVNNKQNRNRKKKNTVSAGT